MLHPLRENDSNWLSLALVSKQLIKEQFFNSSYIQWNRSTHYILQKVQLLEQHDYFVYKNLRYNEELQQHKWKLRLLKNQ